MRKNPVLISLLLMAALIYLTSRTYAQGDFDSSFGNNGASLTAMAPSEALIGADRQTTGVLNDKIIVATTAAGNFTVRRFDANTGLLDTGVPLFGGGTGKQTASVGGTATAGAIAVGSSSEIYVAGQGNTAKKCAVVKFPANGASGTIASLSLPASFSGCDVTSAKFNGGWLYVWGTTRNTSLNKLVFFILRLTPLPFAFDASWGAGGLVSTSILWPNASITQSKSLAFNGTTVYGSGQITAPGSLSGTGMAVLGYNTTGANQGQLSTSFGNRSNISPNVGRGVYLIPGLAGGDMIDAGGNLYLNGNVGGQPAGDFGLVKLNLPATAAGSHAAYPSVDLLGYDTALRLARDNANRLISGGRCDIPPTNLIEVGLAKYDSTSLGLTSSWIPSQLQVLKAGGPTTNPTPIRTRDRRRITPGPNLELLLNSLIVQSTNKIVVVAFLAAGGTGNIWIGRIRN